MKPARPDELTDGTAHAYSILYPSGLQRQVHGVFAILQNSGCAYPAVRTGSTLIVLDPRCAVTRDGLLIYDPRHVVALPAWARAWLVAHPAWPHVATEIVPPC